MKRERLNFATRTSIRVYVRERLRDLPARQALRVAERAEKKKRYAQGAERKMQPRDRLDRVAQEWLQGVR